MNSSQRINPIYEQLHWGDKVVKRGLLCKESPNQENSGGVSQKGSGSPTFLSLPLNSHDVQKARPCRGSDECRTSRRYILAVCLLLSITAFAGSLMFAKSVSPTLLLNDGCTTSYNSFSKLQRRFSLQDSQTASAELGTGFPEGCSEKATTLRVFMYDLPSEFHYGMLVQQPYSQGQIWPRNVSDIPPYLGGLYKQHSVEYWLTSDLLTSNMADRQSVCTAFRVDNWRSADVIFVPFFASLSYNKFTRAEQRALGEDKNQELQEKLMQFLEKQPAWQASGGVDHVIVIHHPNSGYFMRDHLRKAMFVVADFGRYASDVANIGKDIVAPYKHVVNDFEAEDTISYEKRKTLLFFQGAIMRKEGGIIRLQLYKLLNGEPDVHFEGGNTTNSAIRSASEGMQNSKFCLNLAGDTPSSNRLFDAIASHCVPVIISDDIEVPFEDTLNYSTFSIFIKSSDALKSNFIIDLLRGVSREKWTKMWATLKQVEHHFKYQYPTQPDDAVHMTWKAIARKIHKVRLHLNKERRYQWRT